MRKYIKYWPVVALILLVIINVVDKKPRILEDIMVTTPDSVNLHVTMWYGSTPNTISKQLTLNEFQKIIEIMKDYKFRKGFGKKTHRYDGSGFYFITFETYSKRNQKEQIITLSKDGLIQVNKNNYSISTGEKEEEMVSKIYNYIHTMIKEK